VEWPTAEPIDTARLTLEPLAVDHASEMADVLADPRLYEYVGGTPPSEAELEARYGLQVVGHSPDGHRGWLNWIVRERATEAAGAMVEWLRCHATNAIVAHIHPDHEPSMGVARRLGLTPTDILEAGETRWVSAAD
jgi:hypothetical protein